MVPIPYEYEGGGYAAGNYQRLRRLIFERPDTPPDRPRSSHIHLSGQWQDWQPPSANRTGGPWALS